MVQDKSTPPLLCITLSGMALKACMYCAIFLGKLVMTSGCLVVDFVIIHTLYKLHNDYTTSKPRKF